MIRTVCRSLAMLAAVALGVIAWSAIRYLALTAFKGTVEVLRATFERQDYGLAIPSGSALRESINRSLLEKIHQPQWRDVLYRYLGK